MFRETVCQISSGRFSKGIVMALTNSIFYPIKAHIHGLFSFFLLLVVDNAIISGVVSLHGCGRLEVDHFFMGDSYW